MKVRFESLFTLKLVRNHRDEIFVFGDNMQKWGKKGQAVIRALPNAFGIPTKREPKTHEAAYFSDQDDEIAAVESALRALYKLGKTHTLVFPLGGLGTGLAKMEKRSPKAWRRMNQILEDHFGVINGVVSKPVEHGLEP